LRRACPYPPLQKSPSRKETALEPLNFPPFDVLVRENGQRREVLDIIRQRYVALTPEEWVRQHLSRYLIESLQYPRGLISVEAGHRYGALSRRTDLVVYDRQGRSLLLAECKAPHIKLRQDVLDQAARYNLVLGASLVLVTNGLSHLLWRAEPTDGHFQFLQAVPQYTELLAMTRV
jgi:hypothetical protein